MERLIEMESARANSNLNEYKNAQHIIRRSQSKSMDQDPPFIIKQISQVPSKILSPYALPLQTQSSHNDQIDKPEIENNNDRQNSGSGFIAGARPLKKISSLQKLDNINYGTDHKTNEYVGTVPHSRNKGLA